MGCDIHGHIEVRTPIGTWELFASPDIWRNYALFGLLAGIRGEGPAIVAPRGIPRDISRGLVQAYTLEVSSEPDEDHRECLPTDAAAWVRSGASEWWDAQHTRVTDPDAHHVSWLTTDEMQLVCNAVSVGPDDPKGWGRFYPGAVLGAMNGLRQMGYAPRFVFWFDS